MKSKPGNCKCVYGVPGEDKEKVEVRPYPTK